MKYSSFQICEIPHIGGKHQESWIFTIFLNVFHKYEKKNISDKNGLKNKNKNETYASLPAGVGRRRRWWSTSWAAAAGSSSRTPQTPCGCVGWASEQSDQPLYEPRQQFTPLLIEKMWNRSMKKTTTEHQTNPWSQTQKWENPSTNKISTQLVNQKHNR